MRGYGSRLSREDLSRDFFHSILDPAFCLHSLAPLSTKINGDYLKPFPPKSILVPATVHLHNMILIITDKVVLLLSVLLLVSFMNMYSILHAFVISVTDC